MGTLRALFNVAAWINPIRRVSIFSCPPNQVFSVSPLFRALQAIAALLLLLFTATTVPLHAAIVAKKRVVRKTKKKKPVGPPKLHAIGPAANISLARQYLELNNASAALEQANTAVVNVPALNDYAQYYRAQAELSAQELP